MIDQPSTWFCPRTSRNRICARTKNAFPGWHPVSPRKPESCQIFLPLENSCNDIPI
jgi:hypothetical protein